MANRRTFLAALAAIPLIGKVVKLPASPAVLPAGKFVGIVTVASPVALNALNANVGDFAYTKAGIYQFNGTTWLYLAGAK
jgi:hypothetical protein